MYSCLQSPEDFFELYAPQTGGSSPVFKASFKRQKGYGIGGIFGSIARRFLPFLRTHVLPHVLPYAKTAIRNVAVDVLDGTRDWKESIKSNAKGALKDMGRSFIGQSGSGIRRKRKRRSVIKTTQNKKRKISSRKRGKKQNTKSKRKIANRRSKGRKLINKANLFDF